MNYLLNYCNENCESTGSLLKTTNNSENIAQLFHKQFEIIIE